MEMNAFDAMNELKKFYEGNGDLSKLSGLIRSKRLDISLEYVDGAVKLKVTHPLRVYIDEIYNILLRLHLITSTNLTLEFIENGKQKSVSKRFGADDEIGSTIKDLLELPHERVLDIIIDTDSFKLVQTEDMSDNISVILKGGDHKALFRSLINYLFPFVSVTVEKSAKEEINFTMSGDELTVDVLLTVDGGSLGVKSKRVKIVKV